ncbi:MAG: RluA family pseudouridine synthase [Lachnospiraceae bacterium]|nr:RluA family pseudouridine synthase [Lachnospiraceae bacterium]
MVEYIISASESGQHVIKYCKHLYPKAQNGFLHKMLRKKNITVNGKKADGAAILSEGDYVRFYLSDDVLAEIAGDAKKDISVDRSDVQRSSAGNAGKMIKQDRNENFFNPERFKGRILYEDENLILFDKPAGMLSQKADRNDNSANEYLLTYLESKGQLPIGFVPSVCNRLDRNTSGILLFAKSHGAAKELSQLLRDRTFGKYYLAVVLGEVNKPFRLTGFLEKDKKNNQVSVKEVYKQELSDADMENVTTRTDAVRFVEGQADRKKEKDKASSICTDVIPILTNGSVSIVRVHLLTGKTHQIRAHMASVGHPLIGDPKYGNSRREKTIYTEFSVGAKDIPKRQLLHSQSVVFPKAVGTEGELKALASLSGKAFYTQLPEDMDTFLSAVGITDRSFVISL